MKKPADYMTRTEAELASDLIDMKFWADANPQHADHFWVSYEYNPVARRFTNLSAAKRAGLLAEYNEYTARRVAYDFSVDDFGLWHAWYLHNKK